jgi:TRAP-type C4-dicarboxylate transport system permease small subunit
MLAAPWLLRRGQHIRVDIVLRAMPKTGAWYTEWLADVLGLVCCLFMMVNSWSALMASYRSGSLAIKTLVTPEWWSLAPMPVAFALLAIEMLFRMRRLWLADKGPRDDAVSAS